MLFQGFRGIGPELLEQCYHNALYYELKESGFAVEYCAPYTVFYKNQIVGEYLADLVVEKKVVLEHKAVKAFSEAHMAQLINYLRISGCRVGYLVNFQGGKLEFKRMVV